MPVSEQYRDINGNVVPVYIDDHITVQGCVYRGSNNINFPRVDMVRNITFSGGLIEIAYISDGRVYNHQGVIEIIPICYMTFAVDGSPNGRLVIDDTYTVTNLYTGNVTIETARHEFEVVYDVAVTDPAYERYTVLEIDNKKYYIVSNQNTSISPTQWDYTLWHWNTIVSTGRDYGLRSLTANDYTLFGPYAMGLSPVGNMGSSGYTGYAGGWSVEPRLDFKSTIYFWGGKIMTGAGADSGFYTIYLPTVSQASQFSSWLWSSNIFDTIKKLFNDPMQAIIGLMGYYFPITGENTDTIRVGSLDSEITCDWTDDNIKTLSCGSVTVNEQFHNVLDYDGYTQIEIYLPYIGFKTLNTAEVMGGTITVIYKIDIVTGTCVANVSVTKDNVTITTYTFNGDCAIHIPVSGSDHTAIVGSILGSVTGIGAVVGGVLTGNPLLAIGGGVGALSSAAGAKTKVERAGSLAGNTGILAYNKPYLVITRPVTAQATNFEQYYGFPTNQLVLLSNCSGYTRVKDCHLTNIPCTDEELEEIEKLLKRGVII